MVTKCLGRSISIVSGFDLCLSLILSSLLIFFLNSLSLFYCSSYSFALDSCLCYSLLHSCSLILFYSSIHLALSFSLNSSNSFSLFSLVYSYSLFSLILSSISLLFWSCFSYFYLAARNSFSYAFFNRCRSSYCYLL